MNDPAVSIALIVVAIIVALLLIGLALRLLVFAFVGAAHLFAIAAAQEFIGLAVYFACWVFMFPLMLVVCIILGFFSYKADKLEQSSQKTITATSSLPITPSPETKVRVSEWNETIKENIVPRFSWWQDLWFPVRLRAEIRQKKRQIQVRNEFGYDTTEQEQELAKMGKFKDKD